jgi:hypothetical protein
VARASLRTTSRRPSDFPNLGAAQAALWHPGERSVEETLETIGAILDHEDVVAALQGKMRQEETRAHQITGA